QPCRPLHPILPMVFQAPLGGITSWCLACPQGEARLARARDSRRSRDQGRQHDPGSGDSDEPTPVTDSAAEKGGLSAILATKLHQPRLHPTTMDRPRLLTFLRSDPANLVLAVAPPAFGKTTLVAHPLRLHGLRASRALGEIRLWDLSFTPEETEQFLNDVLDLRLRRDSVAHLQNRTEGWPAGLFLAYLSMRDALDRDGFIHRF